MVEEIDYMEDQPAGWEDFDMAYLSSYSDVPTNYALQGSSTNPFPHTQSYFGSYTNPPPQFTFTMTNTPSNVRGHTLQQEQTPQGYQHGSLTRGIFMQA